MGENLPPHGRVKEGGKKLYGSYYLSEESLHTNFRPLVPSLHVKKFVVGGWRSTAYMVVQHGLYGVKPWILVLSFRPKLNNKVFSLERLWTLNSVFGPPG